MLVKNYRDYAGGAGLKFIPSSAYNSRALMNLAHWVFGEDAYVLPDTASSMGTVLPHSGWIFASNSGLSDPDTAETRNRTDRHATPNNRGPGVPEQTTAGTG